jgi:hypothetical protein
MPLYWWPDDGGLRGTPEPPEARGREIAAMLNERGIPRDAPTLLGLVRLTWSVAFELAFDSRTSSITAGRPTRTGQMLRAIPRL